MYLYQYWEKRRGIGKILSVFSHTNIGEYLYLYSLAIVVTSPVYPPLVFQSHGWKYFKSSWPSLLTKEERPF